MTTRGAMRYEVNNGSTVEGGNSLFYLVVVVTRNISTVIIIE